jgi:SAM-dependent methyltransferase
VILSATNHHLNEDEGLFQAITRLNREFQGLQDIGLEVVLSNQEVDECHWTPAEIAVVAAQMLVVRPGIRVLDIGSGTGEFCVAGAIATLGHFTGVEQRGHLVTQAKQTLTAKAIENVNYLHANITEISFDDFDAFYLFNPFQENLIPLLKIDSTVELSAALHDDYVKYVANELAQAPVGTRVVTYIGGYEAIPSNFEIDQQAFDGDLTLWIKR